MYNIIVHLSLKNPSGHCKSLAPEYALAASDLKSNDPPIPLGKVDCTVETAIAGQHEIQGYPTLKIFRNGKSSDYTGPRQRQGIVTYMKKQAGAAIKPINSKSDIDALAQADPTNQYYILGVFSSTDKSKPSQLSASYSLLANRLRDDYVFGKIVGNNKLVKELYNIDIGDEDEGIITVLQNDDIKVYTGDSKQSNVEQFIRTNSVPLVGQYTGSNSEKYSKRGLPIAKLFMKIDKAGFLSKNMKYYINRLKKIAEPLIEKFSVVIADKSEYQQQLTSQYGSKSTDEYIFVIEDISKSKNYKFENNKFDVGKYKDFIQQYVDGKIKPYVKSEAMPEDNSGPVKIVTGQTFEDIVTEDKDVFIEFYAPVSYISHAAVLGCTSYH
jgi:protein disulfide isomerase